jgi:hypothetical protein
VAGWGHRRWWLCRTPPLRYTRDMRLQGSGRPKAKESLADAVVRLRWARYSLIAVLMAGCAHPGANEDLLLFEKAFDESLVFWTTELPPAAVGRPYAFTLQARGKPKPYRWRMVSGQLPPGMQFEDDGAIKGTPSAPTVVSFVAKVVCERQPEASPRGWPPHIGSRLRQFVLVVKEREASSPTRAPGPSEADSVRTP